MRPRTDQFLDELRAALGDAEPALVRDALWDARSHLLREQKRLAWEAPTLSEGEALDRILEAFGPPEAAAQRYRQRETLVQEALGRPQPLSMTPTHEEQPRPWPSFFGVLVDAKAYTSVLYLLLTLVTGVAYWCWIWTGISLSLGLLVLIIGLPILVLFLSSCRALALGEGRLVEALLDVRMPRRPRILPEGHGWLQRLKLLFTDAHTWACLGFLALQFPLGLFYFTLVFTCGTMFLVLLLCPLLCLTPLDHLVMVRTWEGTVPLMDAPVFGLFLASVLGFLGLVLTLHLALGLGRLHGALARALLVRREG